MNWSHGVHSFRCGAFITLCHTHLLEVALLLGLVRAVWALVPFHPDIVHSRPVPVQCLLPLRLVLTARVFAYKLLHVCEEGIIEKFGI